MVEKKVATFQERFSDLIESSPKSRSTIAAEFGVAKQTISAWTTGQSSPRLPVVMSLAEYFGVNSDWLLGFDVPKNVPSKHEEEKTDSVNDHPITFEARLMARGIDQLPADKRKKALVMVGLAFDELATFFKENSDESEL